MLESVQLVARLERPCRRSSTVHCPSSMVAASRDDCVTDVEQITGLASLLLLLLLVRLNSVVLVTCRELETCFCGVTGWMDAWRVGARGLLNGRGNARRSVIDRVF